MKSPTVVVVGAGLAGSAAASALHAAGVAVQVLEGRRRVGGRVWSKQLGDGSVVELGGELVENHYSKMLALVDQFGLELVPGPHRFLRFPFFDHGRIACEDPAEVLPQVERCLRDLVTLAEESSPDRMDTMTVTQGLDLVGLQGMARRWFETLISGWSCRESYDESLLAFVEMRVRPVLASDFRSNRPGWRIRGGNDQIAKMLLAPLWDELRTGQELVAIDWGSDAVRVTTQSEGEFEDVAADAVLLAIPLPAVGRIAVVPEFPDELVRAIRQTSGGWGAKAVISTDDESIPDLFLSSAPRFHAWRSVEASQTPVVTLYVGGHMTRQLAQLQQCERAALANEWLSACCPDAAATATQTVVAVWKSEPLTISCGPVFGPGAFCRRSAWHGQRVGRHLYFAGDYASVGSPANMETALCSGFEAAEQIIKDLT